MFSFIRFIIIFQRLRELCMYSSTRVCFCTGIVFSVPLYTVMKKETKQGQNIAQLADVTYASQVTAFFSVFSVLG